MGLFDFLKKKDTAEKKVVQKSQEKETPGIFFRETNPNISIDEEIKHVTEKYAALESKIVIRSPTCPYCSAELEKIPDRKRKCPYCGNTIFVRTSAIAHDKILLTDKTVEKSDDLWWKYRYSLRWMKTLSQRYDVSSSAFSKKRTELAKKFGSEPNQPDVIWGIFNDLAIEMMKASPVDYGGLSGLYFSQAMFLYEDDKPFFEMLQQSNRMMLMRYQQQGVSKVKIPICSESCEECRKYGGRTLSVNQALKEMPIPRKDCTHELEKGKPGWCRCTYAYA